ncbi:hypothetical protein GCM10008967_00420 [Bacillus carboniphilus]|uniref:Uncharacterized protein n=1 Tax=Bacillus carboniphilus TaxID=86663 RepID=A0ABN0VP84_9BACI
MLKPDEFVKMFGNEEPEKITRNAKVDPNYTSGRPSLVFDGETKPTVKKYTHLESYTPAPNDRVMVINNVIVGKIV